MAKARKLSGLTIPKLRALLHKHDGKIKLVAQELNVTVQAVYYWMHAHNCQLSNTLVCEVEPTQEDCAAR